MRGAGSIARSESFHPPSRRAGDLSAAGSGGICCAAVALLTFLLVAVAAAALTFPALTGRVVDEAGILDPSAKAALERKLADFETKTTGQLVVVTLKSLQGTSIEDYGYQLGRHWQIGQKEKNTGALLIVAPNERKVRIEVGYGFEGTLTDAVSKLIIENAIIPRFRANDFAGGINRGVDDIIQAVSVDSEEWKTRAKQQRPDSQPGLADLLTLLFFGVILFMIMRSIARERREQMQAGPGVRRGPRGPVILPMPGSWGSSDWSSGGGGWSGGGGFSGGGGSFGGGGASGSW